MYLNLINQLVIKKTKKQKPNIWINKERKTERKLPTCESNKKIIK